MGILSLVGLPVVIAITVCSVVSAIALRMVIFSKAVFAIVLALPLSSSLTIFANSNLLNFLAWLSITLAITFVLCLLPRFKNAYQLFCNILVSYILAELIVNGVLTIIIDGYTPKVSVEIIIKVVTVLFSLLTLYSQIMNDEQKNDLNISVVKSIDRILASFLYAIIAVILIVVSMDSLWTYPTMITWLIFIGIFVLAFVVDKVFHTQIKQKIDMLRENYQEKTGARFGKAKKKTSNQTVLTEDDFDLSGCSEEDKEILRQYLAIEPIDYEHIERIEKRNRKIERQRERDEDYYFWETERHIERQEREQADRDWAYERDLSWRRDTYGDY